MFLFPSAVYSVDILFNILAILVLTSLSLITKRVNICNTFPCSDLGHCNCKVNVFYKTWNKLDLFVIVNECKFSPSEEAHHLAQLFLFEDNKIHI